MLPNPLFLKFSTQLLLTKQTLCVPCSPLPHLLNFYPRNSVLLKVPFNGVSLARGNFFLWYFCVASLSYWVTWILTSPDCHASCFAWSRVTSDINCDFTGSSLFKILTAKWSLCCPFSMTTKSQFSAYSYGALLKAFWASVPFCKNTPICLYFPFLDWNVHQTF